MREGQIEIYFAMLLPIADRQTWKRLMGDISSDCEVFRTKLLSCTVTADILECQPSLDKINTLNAKNIVKMKDNNLRQS